MHISSKQGVIRLVYITCKLSSDGQPCRKASTVARQSPRTAQSSMTGKPIGEEGCFCAVALTKTDNQHLSLVQQEIPAVRVLTASALSSQSSRGLLMVAYMPPRTCWVRAFRPAAAAIQPNICLMLSSEPAAAASSLPKDEHSWWIPSCKQCQHTPHHMAAMFVQARTSSQLWTTA